MHCREALDPYKTAGEEPRGKACTPLQKQRAHLDVAFGDGLQECRRHASAAPEVEHTLTVVRKQDDQRTLFVVGGIAAHIRSKPCDRAQQVLPSTSALVRRHGGNGSWVVLELLVEPT